MRKLRRADERGRVDFGWLDTRYTFSFAGYHDPRHMGFRDLRVINDDRVAAGAGFPTHGHRDMEIVTWVVEGALEHRDSLGHGSVIRPGDVQRMSAGTGIEHSEFNPSPTDPLRLLQVWILPRSRGVEPGYEQRHFDEQDRRGRLRLIASPDGRDGSVTLGQDVEIHSARLERGARVQHTLRPGRHAWLQVVRGGLAAGELHLVEGDGLAVSDEPELALAARSDAEVLLFDLN